jgi:hypothetical protein
MDNNLLKKKKKAKPLYTKYTRETTTLKVSEIYKVNKI